MEYSAENERKIFLAEVGITNLIDLGIHGDYYVSVLCLGQITKKIFAKKSKIDDADDRSVARWGHAQDEIKIFTEEVRQAYQTYLQEKYRERF